MEKYWARILASVVTGEGMEKPGIVHSQQDPMEELRPWGLATLWGGVQGGVLRSASPKKRKEPARNTAKTASAQRH